MKLLFGLIFCIFLSGFTVKAQTPVVSSAPPVESEDEFVCGLKQSSIIQFDVSVTDRKNNFLEGLTYKDFEVFCEKEVYEIEFFKFDELKNQYVIGVREDDFNNKSDWSNVKIKLKSRDEKENYGKFFVRVSKAYRLD